MSSTPREIGTLIVVVLRANHLPNKRHIGKQDPYCLVTVNGERRRTKAIKRGGQHPEWDEEIRFTLFEDVEDVLARTAHGDGTPPPPPPKDDKKLKKIKGGKTMKLACYADDPREPDLIGDAEVDLTEVLTKGETDEWFTLSNKDKFAGKVYLELTFWSNEPPPEKKVTPKPPKNNKQYGGPGSFVPSGELAAGNPPSRIASSSVLYSHSRQNSDIIPSSMRASSSATNLDLYVPPYERNRNTQMDNLTQGFSEFGVAAPRRRESFPPVPGSYMQPQHGGMGQLTTYPAYGHEPSISETASVYSYDRPLTPNGQPSSHLLQNSASQIPYTFTQGYQQPSYEASSPTYQIPGRGPRHSVPTASSGFMPIHPPSGFTPLASHASEPSGFAPPPSHTPAPMGYNSQFHPHTQPVYPPSLSNTPVPTSNGSYLHHSTSLAFHPQQSFPASQSYNYTTYSIPQSTSAPPQHFASPSVQLNVSQPTNSAPPQLYSTMTSTQEVQSAPASHANGQSSRPLPQQPQVVYTQQQQQAQPITTSHSLPSQAGLSQSANSYSPTQAGNSYTLTNGFSPVPPPPPPPPLQYNTTAPVVQTNPSNLPIPPPPPPPPSNNQPRRRASLPQPPVGYQQPLPQPTYQQLPPPPPPPPPIEYYGQNPLPPPPPPPLIDTTASMHKPTIYQQGLPPKPPAPVDEYGQWIQQHGNSNSPNFQTSDAY